MLSACQTGKQYRIHFGQAANIREMDEADNPKVGRFFVPKGYLVATKTVF
jgi:hypothetical protein